MNPEELRYSPTHEWVGVEELNGVALATVGITDFAVEQLTNLVYIDLPKQGRILQPGEAFGEVESVKAVSSLYSPVGGEIVQVNTTLKDRLETLNDDPFGLGWIIKIRLTDAKPLDSLLTYDQYRLQCESEH